MTAQRVLTVAGWGVAGILFIASMVLVGSVAEYALEAIGFLPPMPGHASHLLGRCS